jgi:hypothetical protein
MTVALCLSAGSARARWPVPQLGLTQQEKTELSEYLKSL